jgi:hypothetical protein
VNIPQQFTKIYILFAHNGLVAVLKQMPMPAMAQIVTDGVTGQKPSHQTGQPMRAAFDQYMGMVVQKRPGKDRGFGLNRQAAQPRHKIPAVVIVLYNQPLLNAANNNMM